MTKKDYKHCPGCNRQLNQWDIRCCRALKTKWMCENCLAKSFGKDLQEFNEFLEMTFDMHQCCGVVTERKNKNNKEE